MGIVEDIKKEVADSTKSATFSIDKKGFVDVLTEKTVSRKLLVWIAATILLSFGKITQDEWMAVSLSYVGMQGLADIAVKWKTASN